MARGQLFEYAVLYHPKPTKDPAGNDTTPKSTLVIAPATVLAVDEKEVGLKVARLIPADYDDKLDLVEVIVRPF